VSQYEVLPRRLLGGTEESAKYFSQDSRSPNRDLNPVSILERRFCIGVRAFM
jgi:hypothetical protein